MPSALGTIERSHLWPWVTNTCRAIGRLSGCVSAIWTSSKHQALHFHPTLLEACKLKAAYLKWTAAFSDGNCPPLVGIVGVSAQLDLTISVVFSNLNDSMNITLFSCLFFLTALNGQHFLHALSWAALTPYPAPPVPPSRPLCPALTSSPHQLLSHQTSFPCLLDPVHQGDLTAARLLAALLGLSQFLASEMGLCLHLSKALTISARPSRG